MILDERGEFADALALSTSATGLALIGDVIDTTKARNLAGGKQAYVVIQITTAVTSGDAATLGFVLASDAQAAIAADGTATEHARTGQIGKAALVAGYTFILPIPPEGTAKYERYLGILQNVGGFVLTAGAINAFITLDVKQWAAYADHPGA